MSSIPHAVNIVDILRLHAGRMPQQVALVEGREIVTWAELHGRVAASAWQLRAHEVAAGDVVAISLRSGIAQLVTALAAARLGAAGCLMDWRSRPAESATILATLAPRLLVREPTAAAQQAVRNATMSEAWHRLPQAAAAPATSRAPDGPAFLLLSSGTTGEPKAMVLTHSATAWRALIRSTGFAIGRGHRVLGTVPLANSAGLGAVMASLLAGATTWLLPPLASTEALLETLLGERIQHVALVPTVMRGLLELANGPAPLLPELLTLVALGSAFHADEKQAALAKVSPAIHDLYGSAGIGGISFAGPADIRAHPDAVGRAALFTEVEIVDEHGQVLPAGAIGRIRARSPALAGGYLGETGRSERNEIFADGWAYSGDLGRLDDEGLLYLEGRAASLIVRGGQNIYPEEIERVLLGHPQVAEAAVIGMADARLGEEPVALVVARGAVDAAALASHCRANLQAAKVPVAFHFVQALPRNAAGKIRRSELAALVAENREQATEDR